MLCSICVDGKTSNTGSVKQSEIAMALNYATYLKLNELLALQHPVSEGKAHDEMLFIIVHQTYELWFKGVLHELEYLQGLLHSGSTSQSAGTLKRIITILKVLIQQMDILETMTSQQFMAFRNFLGSASGFQSLQFRELEFILGAKRPEILRSFPEGYDARARLEKRYKEPTVWDAFLRYLIRKKCAIPQYVLDRDTTSPLVPSEAIQKVLLEVYAEYPSIAFLCELLLDMDEAIQEWRYKHVKMVERMIGSRHGTGGSEGVEYLKNSLFKPFFPDLWLIRTRFQKL